MKLIKTKRATACAVAAIAVCLAYGVVQIARGK